MPPYYEQRRQRHGSISQQPDHGGPSRRYPSRDRKSEPVLSGEAWERRTHGQFPEKQSRHSGAYYYDNRDVDGKEEDDDEGDREFSEDDLAPQPSKADQAPESIYSEAEAQSRYCHDDYKEYPQMTTAEFEGDRYLHIDSNELSICQDKSTFPVYPPSQTVYGLFLPKKKGKIILGGDSSLYHIQFERTTGDFNYQTMVTYKGTLDNSIFPQVTYPKYHEPGISRMSEFVGQIEKEPMAFGREISFRESKMCMRALSRAIERTEKKMQLPKDSIQLESFVSACPKEEFVRRNTKAWSYNAWISCKNLAKV